VRASSAMLAARSSLTSWLLQCAEFTDNADQYSVGPSHSVHKEFNSLLLISIRFSGGTEHLTTVS
jgi:hypothetical protein